MGKRILIVNDAKYIRNDLGEYLLKHGYLVRDASSIEQAKTIIRSEAFDYAIIDLKLGYASDYGGITLLLFMKSAQPTIRPIILSPLSFSGQVENELRKKLFNKIVRATEREALLSEIKNNYIYTGSEQNYISAIMGKLDVQERTKDNRIPFMEEHKETKSRTIFDDLERTIRNGW